jgi:hypothetical protein
MIQAKTGIVVLLIGLAAIYTFYVPPHEDAVTQSLPEYYWYEFVLSKTCKIQISTSFHLSNFDRTSMLCQV